MYVLYSLTDDVDNVYIYIRLKRVMDNKQQILCKTETKHNATHTWLKLA